MNNELLKAVKAEIEKENKKIKKRVQRIQLNMYDLAKREQRRASAAPWRLSDQRTE